MQVKITFDDKLKVVELALELINAALEQLVASLEL